ncbi:MAG: hypothetical protein JXB49_31215 [Bacteroidales bacterium]|nr:hypothetical protein [Bacteroidales bacterium]
MTVIGKRNIMKRYLVLLLSLIYLMPLHAQQKVQVVTKKVLKDISYSRQQLIINAEKADINIEGWEKNTVSIEMQLISKNTDIEEAKSDLKCSKYEIKESNESIILTNYFSAENNHNIKSNLSVVYTIKVPYKCPANIINLYGDIEISSLHSAVIINNSFGAIILNNMDGDIKVLSNYADITAVNIDGKLLCQAEKANITINDASGYTQIISSYGKVEFNPGDGFIGLKVRSGRTDIVVEVESFENYGYNLKTKSDKIILPDEHNGKVSDNKNISDLMYNLNSEKPVIDIQTTYCPIVIKRK